MRNRFYISNKEKNGAIGMILTVLLFYQFPNIISIIYPSKTTNTITKTIEEVSEKPENPVVIDSQHIPFDPNKTDIATLLQNGFSTYSANNLIKYVNSGGSFKSTRDLLKIYGIDSALVLSLDSLIIIKQRLSKSQYPIDPNRSSQINSGKSIKFNASALSGLDLNPGPFDPNKASKDELLNHKISNRAVGNIIKYREKGGIFKRPDDLKRIYGLDSITFTSISKMINIDSNYINSKVNKVHLLSADEDTLILDLNIASGLELQSLKGIGPVLSKRIIDYRDKLGGFLNHRQLGEVYGLEKEVIGSIKHHIVISPKLKKIYPPNHSFKELLGHPYLTYEDTKKLKNISILDYENEIEQIIINQELDPRIVPYLHLSEPVKG